MSWSLLENIPGLVYSDKKGLNLSKSRTINERVQAINLELVKASISHKKSMTHVFLVVILLAAMHFAGDFLGPKG